MLFRSAEECGGSKRDAVYPDAICNRGYTRVEVSPYNVTFSFINWSNGISLYNYTINNTAPSVSLIFPNQGGITHGAFIFNYEDLEYDTGKNCNLYIDSIQKVTEHGTTSGIQTTFRFTDLTEGSHNWYLNCSDGALSSISNTREFTYLIDRAPISTYSPTQSEVKEGYSQLLRQSQKIHVIINNQTYTIIINFIDKENKKVKKWGNVKTRLIGSKRK